MPYEIRPCENSEWWLVYDIRTNEVVEVDGVVCDALEMGEADDLADLLNTREAEGKKATKQ